MVSINKENVMDHEEHIHEYIFTTITGWPRCSCGKLYPEGLPK